jgi:hypothetical protein
MSIEWREQMTKPEPDGGNPTFGVRVSFDVCHSELAISMGSSNDPTQSRLIQPINPAEIVKNFTNFLAPVVGGD